MRKLYDIILYILMSLGAITAIYEFFESSELKFMLSIFILWVLTIIYRKLHPEKQKLAKILSIAFFVLYAIIALELLIFGRYSMIDYYSSYEEYSKTGLVLVPFKTISEYIPYIFTSRTALYNIIGNIAIFMPFGIFLPTISNTFKRFVPFTLITIFTIITVEIVQFLTMRGVCDIDDLILNLLGAEISFFILKLPFLQNKSAENQ